MENMEYKIKFRDTLHFYTVSNKLIEAFKAVDSNVCDNYNERRAHIGIILEVHDKMYLAPLTSNNKKYLKENAKYKRIVYPIENGELGFVRIGNMIPIVESEVSPVIIANIENVKYKNLLINQYSFLRKTETIHRIRSQANKLYEKRLNNDRYFLADIMCNFKLLEEICSKMIE